MTLDEGLARLSALVQLRANIDTQIETRWILIAIASYFLWILYALAALSGTTAPLLNFDQTLGLMGTLALVSSTGLSFLVYNLIRRQNNHIERAQEIARELLNRIESRAGPNRNDILLPLNSAEQDLSNIEHNIREHSAILWALLVLIPYFGWILLVFALYLTTRSSNAHNKTEFLLFEDLDRTLAAAGSRPPSFSNRPPSSRNSLGFLLVSLLTFAGFVASWAYFVTPTVAFSVLVLFDIVSLTWLYILIIGEKAHFSFHYSFEPELLRALSSLGSLELS